MSGWISRLQEQAPVTEADDSPEFVRIGGEEADAVFDALSSKTSRLIYERLLDEPATPSALADAVDTSIQNVSHHLSNLESAGLIESVGTRYSDKGREMTIWASSSGSVVLVGDGERPREALREHLAALAVIVLLGAVVQLLAAALESRPSGDLVEPASPGTPTGPRGIVHVVLDALGVVEPGVLVVLGGVIALAFLRYRSR